uniref:Uncharacterized protein n=1 Tax=Acrobeloides nanus TaxID=290746 RepID=A0A914CQ19_9BILA
MNYRLNRTSRSSTETNSTTSSYQIRVNKQHSSHRRVDFINLDDEIDKIMQEAIKPIPPVRQTSKHLATSMTNQLIQLSPKTHPSNEGSIIVSLSAEIDNLPEPPSISMKEIEELNKAFNNDYESPKVATPVSNEHLLAKHKTEDNDEKIKNSMSMETENFDDVKSIDMIPDKNKAVKRTSTLDLPTVNKILRKETMDVLEKPGPQYVTDWRSIRPVGSPQVSPRWRSQSQPKEGYISKLRESFEPVQNTSVAKLKLSEDKLHEMLKSLGTKNKTNNLEDTISIHQNSARLSNIDIKTNFVNHESSYERPRSASSYYLKNSSVEKNMIV